MAAIDLGAVFLGKRWRAPLLISCMTGGDARFLALSGVGAAH
jgi:isopentenyl diphosphate isomerase/L-lactate dehydrogenase-like FMN-dependent dehydrogenase